MSDHFSQSVAWHSSCSYSVQPQTLKFFQVQTEQFLSFVCICRQVSTIMSVFGAWRICSVAVAQVVLGMRRCRWGDVDETSVAAVPVMRWWNVDPCVVGVITMTYSGADTSDKVAGCKSEGCQAWKKEKVYKCRNNCKRQHFMANVMLLMQDRFFLQVKGKCVPPSPLTQLHLKTSYVKMLLAQHSTLRSKTGLPGAAPHCA